MSGSVTFYPCIYQGTQFNKILEIFHDNLNDIFVETLQLDDSITFNKLVHAFVGNDIDAFETRDANPLRVIVEPIDDSIQEDHLWKTKVKYIGGTDNEEVSACFFGWDEAQTCQSE